MKHKKMKLHVLLGCLSLTALLAAAAPEKALAEEAVPASGPLRIQGTFHREGESLMVTDITGDTNLDVLILNTSDETRILDAENGFPVAADALGEGETIQAYISPAMALSMPPQSYSELILCQLPESREAPRYETVKSLAPQADSSYLLTTTRGTSYRVDSSTVLLPYLTRNIVTVLDLAKGRNFLVWPGQDAEGALSYDADARAEKLVLFPEDTDVSSPSGPASDPDLQ